MIPLTDLDADTADAIARTPAAAGFTSHDTVHLLAVLDGAKPGLSYTTTAPVQGPHDDPPTADEWDRTHPLARLCRILDLPYRLWVNTPEQTSQQFLNFEIARDEAHLAHAPPYEQDGERVSLAETDPEIAPRFGRFIGVPEADNCWWFDPEYADSDDADEFIGGFGPYRPLTETTGRSLSDGEFHAVSQVPWFPRPTADGIERAIEAGAAYCEAAERFDATFWCPGFSAAREMAKNATETGWWRPSPREDAERTRFGTATRR